MASSILSVGLVRGGENRSGLVERTCERFSGGAEGSGLVSFSREILGVRSCKGKIGRCGGLEEVLGVEPPRPNGKVLKSANLYIGSVLA
jgi:hypothetical protein